MNKFIYFEDIYLNIEHIVSIKKDYYFYPHITKITLSNGDNIFSEKPYDEVMEEIKGEQSDG